MNFHLDLSFLLPNSSPVQTVEPDNTQLRTHLPNIIENALNENSVTNDVTQVALFEVSPQKQGKPLQLDKRKSNEQTSLGQWSFNNRKRKRIYVSLTGKKLEGVAALSQSRQDKQDILHPTNSIRSEMYHVMCCFVFVL
jgi:hypothetical protein